VYPLCKVALDARFATINQWDSPANVDMLNVTCQRVLKRR
jgi:hypothetical protein